MTVAAPTLLAAEQVLAEAGTAADGARLIRSRLPGIPVVTCDSSDIDVLPYRSFANFDLHLLNAADHCAELTNDTTQATGLVLAVRSPA